ncbi:hypothetical protein BN2476_500115 [Paraburkholderia piptadeniae]|uniref:Uncharacterized protein n=1 Tax=Paraburkholderia piptadeniae TaxID=1701573 RepID=A0A1N7SFX5_9BURK|nr:hypothetical protein BN2476_500115 [Paraburkholderia piptadeniae]
MSESTRSTYKTITETTTCRCNPHIRRVGGDYYGHTNLMLGKPLKGSARPGAYLSFSSKSQPLREKGLPRKRGKYQVSRFDLQVAAHCACRLLDTDRSRSEHGSRLDWSANGLISTANCARTPSIWIACVASRARFPRVRCNCTHSSGSRLPEACGARANPLPARFHRHPNGQARQHGSHHPALHR